MWKKWKPLLAWSAIIFACTVLPILVIDWLTAPDDDGEAVRRVHAMAAEAVARYEQQFAQSASDAVPTGATAATDMFDSLIPLLERVHDEQPYQDALTLQDEKHWSEWTGDEIDALAVFLDEHTSLLRDIRTLADPGQPVYHLDLSAGWKTELPHLKPLRTMARLLCFEAAVRAYSGDLEGAMDDYLAILELAETLVQEPFTFSQIVRALLESTAFEGMGSALPSDQLNLKQAWSFAQKTEDMYHREGLEGAFAYEAVLYLDYASGAPFTRPANGKTMPVLPDTNAITMTLLYPSPLGDNIISADRETCASLMERIILAAKDPYYEAQVELDAIEVEVSQLSFLKGYTRVLVPELMQVQRLQPRNEALLDLMRMGLLLEAQRAATGSSPANLDALANALGGSVPVDPFTGQSYVYIPKGNTFILYSLGMNQVDDSGRHNYLEGDIVWRGREEPGTAQRERRRSETGLSPRFFVEPGKR